MDLLKNFLERFKHIKDPKEDKLKVAEIISQSVGTTISFNQLEIKNGMVVLNGIPPIARSLIYMKKETLLIRIKESLPSLSISDIR